MYALTNYDERVIDVMHRNHMIITRCTGARLRMTDRHSHANSANSKSWQNSVWS